MRQDCIINRSQQSWAEGGGDAKGGAHDFFAISFSVRTAFMVSRQAQRRKERKTLLRHKCGMAVIQDCFAIPHVNRMLNLNLRRQ